MSNPPIHPCLVSMLKLTSCTARWPCFSLWPMEDVTPNNSPSCPPFPNLFFSLARIPLFCNIEICSVDCGSHGVCMGGTCRCEEGWTGPACNQRACHPRCAEHGTCKDGKCECSQGWNGEHCTIGRPAHSSQLPTALVPCWDQAQTCPWQISPPPTLKCFSLSSIYCKRDQILRYFQLGRNSPRQMGKLLSIVRILQC